MLKSGLRLVIDAYDAEGRAVDHQVKETDLYLWNIGVLMAHWLKRSFNTADPTAYGAKDENNADATYNSYLFASGQFWGSTGTYVANWNNTLRAYVGSGTVAPVITDYNLGQVLANVQPTCPKLITTYNSSILKIVFSATFPFAEATNCSEIGLKMKGWEAATATAKNIFITRDTFNQVQVPAGGSLTVQFEMWFNGTPT